MSLLSYARALRAKFWNASQAAADIEDELQSHLQLRADDLERAGLTRSEALRQARREFGGHTRFKEEAYEALGANFLDVLRADVRYSLRVLRKSPGFTAVATSTLALAICANAVVFGVLNGLILRPLDVPQAESLYGLEHGNEHNMWESYPDYLDLRDRNRSFDGLAGFSVDQAGLDTGDSSSRAWVYTVTANYFDVLRLQPYRGRFFHASDEHGPNSAPYIVLSHSYWHVHFQDDPGVIGRAVRINKHPFTIVGIAPASFHGTLAIGLPDFFVPIIDQQQIEGKNTLEVRRSHTLFMTFGHLKPGVTPGQAIADLNSIGAYLEKTFPRDHGSTTFTLARPGLYGNLFSGPMRAFVGCLLLLTGLILLAACANLGSLFSARASDRSRDVALRLAIGAARGRILRQLLTEAALISVAGGLAGLCASIWILRALVLWRPFPKYPTYLPVVPDASVYAFALALAVGSAILFGIVPARQVFRTNPYQVMKAGSGAFIGRKLTLRDFLVAVQIAICAILVTSSIVAVRGLGRSLHSSFGFDAHNVLLGETEMTMAGYADAQVPSMQQRLLDKIQSIPGVETAGIIGRVPLAGGGFSAPVFRAQTSDLRLSNAAADAVRFNISPEYFNAAGTKLIAGRAFSRHDDSNSTRVAIVNREFAAKLFGSTGAAVGSLFKLRDGTRLQIVGVVEDGKYVYLTEDSTPALFLPLLQAPMNESALVIRCTHDPQQVASAIRAVIREIDSGLPVFLETWNEQLKFPLFPARIATISLGLLGIMGAMLSITGIFGMAAYSVSKRLKEIGIRVAIGAQPRKVLQAALSRAFKLLAVGSMTGLFLGIVASRLLASIVYQATPRDPLVIAAVIFVMLSLGLLATWLPARRALSIDPLTLLREE